MISRDNDSHLLLYNVDATPGTSGAIVNLFDKQLLKHFKSSEGIAEDKEDITKMAMAIHIGYD